MHHGQRVPGINVAVLLPEGAGGLGGPPFAPRLVLAPTSVPAHNPPLPTVVQVIVERIVEVPIEKIIEVNRDVLVQVRKPVCHCPRTSGSCNGFVIIYPEACTTSCQP